MEEEIKFNVPSFAHKSQSLRESISKQKDYLKEQGFLINIETKN